MTTGQLFPKGADPAAAHVSGSPANGQGIKFDSSSGLWLPADVILEGDARLTNARTPTAHTHPRADISDATAFGRSRLADVDAAAARTGLGLGSAATHPDADFAAAVHTHDDRYYTDAETDALLAAKQSAAIAATDAELAAAIASTLAVVSHGAAAGTARPSGYGLVVWVGTVLPTNAADGDVLILNVDTTNGVKWMLQLRTASSNAAKWEYLGGSDLVVAAAAGRALTNQTSYANLPTDPMSMTIPFAGDYDITVAAHTTHSAEAGANSFGSISYAVGATAASDTWGAESQHRVNAAVTVSPSFTRRHTGVAASATVAEKARTAGNYTITWADRSLRVRPVRIG